MENKQQLRFRIIQLTLSIFLGIFLCSISSVLLYTILGSSETGTVFGNKGLIIAIEFGVLSGILLGSISSVIKSKHAGKLTAMIMGMLIGVLAIITLYLFVVRGMVFRGANLFIGLFVSFWTISLGLFIGSIIGTIFDTVLAFFSRRIIRQD